MPQFKTKWWPFLQDRVIRDTSLWTGAIWDSLAHKITFTVEPLLAKAPVNKKLLTKNFDYTYIAQLTNKFT
jgi:hypothetical protein